MSWQSCDALIVGGGPAGSSCARMLCQAGLKVIVLDKSTFPRDKICAGWITPPVVDLLQLDEADYSQQRVWQPLYGFRCGVIHGGSVDVRYDSPISYGMRRCEFDHYLLRRSGAEVQRMRVQSIERKAGWWTVNDEVRTPMLIGAGGHFCPVAKWMGQQHALSEHVVVAQEVEFPIPDTAGTGPQVDPTLPQLFFCKDMQGYGWCFRKQGVLNVGLGRLDPKNLSAHVQDFRDFLQSDRQIGVEIPPRFHGHAYRIYDGSLRVPFDDGLLLIGDAAGLAYQESGEGIRPAVESGLLAAHTILQADGDYDAARLADYPAQIRARFGKHAPGSWLHRLPASWLAAMAAKLLQTQWFTRHFVMDQWFLRKQEQSVRELGTVPDAVS